MKRIRQALCFIIIVLMLISITPNVSYAAEKNNPKENDDNGIAVTLPGVFETELFLNGIPYTPTINEKGIVILLDDLRAATILGDNPHGYRIIRGRIVDSQGNYVLDLESKMVSAKIEKYHFYFTYDNDIPLCNIRGTHDLHLPKEPKPDKPNKPNKPDVSDKPTTPNNPSINPDITPDEPTTAPETTPDDSTENLKNPTVIVTSTPATDRQNRIVYLDSDFVCHVNPGDGLRAFETDFFDGKCDEFIEGYRIVPSGESWTRGDGEVFTGEMISPAVNYSKLEAAQEQYMEERIDTVLGTEKKPIYIDSDYRCHVGPGENLREIQTDFFDGKCDVFIEGYRFVPSGETWTRDDGEVFKGEMIAPAVNYTDLEKAQYSYLSDLNDKINHLPTLNFSLNISPDDPNTYYFKAEGVYLYSNWTEYVSEVSMQYDAEESNGFLNNGENVKFSTKDSDDGVFTIITIENGRPVTQEIMNDTPSQLNLSDSETDSGEQSSSMTETGSGEQGSSVTEAGSDEQVSSDSETGSDEQGSSVTEAGSDEQGSSDSETGSDN